MQVNVFLCIAVLQYATKVAWSLKMSLFSFEITVATLWKKMADVSFTFILVRFNSSNYQCTKNYVFDKIDI